MVLHLFTNVGGLEFKKYGEPFNAWTEEEAQFGDVPITVYEHEVISTNGDGYYRVRTSLPKEQTHLVVSVDHRGLLSETDQELLRANIEALLREVRPDLVQQGLLREVIDVGVCFLDDVQ